MDKTQYITWLTEEIRRVYQLSQRGEPDDRLKYRLEGMIHAGVLLGVYSQDDIRPIIEQEHLLVFNETVAQRRSRLARQQNLDQLQQSDPDAFYNIPACERRELK